MTKTKLTFYGGLKTIGGTIISLQYGKSRVIFDFGLVYSPQTNIFDGQIKERESALVSDYLKLGMLPYIDGIYSQKSLTKVDGLLPADKKEGDTAVLISHLHLDHMAAMGLVDPSIPVYMSRDSLYLYQCLEIVGEGVPGERTYQSFDYNKSFYVGEIKITPIPVDHDVLGACGFHFETPDGSLVYTGDLRLHGSNPELTDQFMKNVKDLGFDAVIMEATTLSQDEEIPEEILKPNRELPDDLLTEPMVISQYTKLLKETNGLGIVNFYHRNIERLKGVFEAGKRSNRKVVLEAESAYLAVKLLNASDFYIYESEVLQQEKQANKIKPWKMDLLQQIPAISCHEINKEPQSYLLQISYPNSLELFDLDVQGGIYLHSNGTPLGDYDPAYQNLLKLLNYIGLERLEIGTSGHAIPQHLTYIVKELDPKVLIPLHSFHPERLKAYNGIQFLPEYGKTYKLYNGVIE